MERLCCRIGQIEVMYSSLSVTAGKPRLGHSACSHHTLLRTGEKEKGTLESLGICSYRGHVGNVKVFLNSSISAPALLCLLTFLQLKVTTFHQYCN